MTELRQRMLLPTVTVYNKNLSVPGTVEAVSSLAGLSLLTHSFMLSASSGDRGLPGE